MTRPRRPLTARPLLETLESRFAPAADVAAGVEPAPEDALPVLEAPVEDGFFPDIVEVTDDVIVPEIYEDPSIFWTFEDSLDGPGIMPARFDALDATAPTLPTGISSTRGVLDLSIPADLTFSFVNTLPAISLLLAGLDDSADFPILDPQTAPEARADSQALLWQAESIGAAKSRWLETPVFAHHHPVAQAEGIAGDFETEEEAAEPPTNPSEA